MANNEHPISAISSDRRGEFFGESRDNSLNLDDNVSEVTAEEEVVVSTIEVEMPNGCVSTYTDVEALRADVLNGKIEKSLRARRLIPVVAGEPDNVESGEASGKRSHSRPRNGRPSARLTN